ncbi:MULTISPECIES: GNAT family N-acetyltransferase [Photobacterium]|uniref:Acetyltransferase n=1 Tax=Photobacterium ganghwense TaxID=320778 RepID=A0A0J1H7C6_9GAMM|nr:MULTISPECIES: N-acetyltransferase [Photobacterium]KLV07640.1 acetyltransferase [Photobacterium ganghwense]MBV1839015.1 N-acetyltransferase [Photobacterium ganghwense]PSU11506.1 N-acetyltransferase [Photobacterium ganghwense]QSV13622.1 N-acetyltransferase [Photobacterium ganghwense]
MLIRSESPADILPIEALLKSVFDTEAEANLVQRLRENGNRTLALVACNDDGEVIGYAFFSPVTLDGQDDNWQGLAPMAVSPAYQGQGIGQAMMEEAKQTLAELGYPVVVVLGHSEYYPKAGFEPAVNHGLQCQWPVPEEAFMVLELIPGTLAGRQGTIAYCEEFSAL